MPSPAGIIITTRRAARAGWYFPYFAVRLNGRQLGRPPIARRTLHSSSSIITARINRPRLEENPVLALHPPPPPLSLFSSHLRNRWHRKARGGQEDCASHETPYAPFTRVRVIRANAVLAAALARGNHLPPASCIPRFHTGIYESPACFAYFCPAVSTNIQR